MSKGVPLFFGGPTPSRFYYIGGDHWIVESGDDETVALLRQKRYSLWNTALWSFTMPLTIFSLATTLAIAISNYHAFWWGTACACVTALPMIYIRQTEMKQLKRKPCETFVMYSNGNLDIQGETYPASNISTPILEYTFYQPPVNAQGDAGCSELDIVFLNGVRERRINLLAQSSNRAWKHAIKLQQLTNIELRRVLVAI